MNNTSLRIVLFLSYIFIVNAVLYSAESLIHYDKVDYLDNTTYYIVSFGPIANCSYGYDLRIVTFYIIMKNNLNKIAIEKNYNKIMKLFNQYYNATCEILSINEGFPYGLKRLKNWLGSDVVNFYVSEYYVEYNPKNKSFKKTMSPEEYLKNYERRHKK